MSPEETVDAFIAAVERRDLAAAGALLAEGVSYENVPMQPVVGRAATVAVLESFLTPAADVEWVIKRQVASGDVVVNERIDRFCIGATWIELPVAGFFVVDGGLITLWRDYFDLATFTNQMAALPQP